MLIRLLLSLVLLPHGDLSVRISEKSKEIESHPENGLLYLQRGELYLQHEQSDSALVDFQHSLTLKPDTSAVYILLAEAYLNLDQYKKGMAAVDEFLKLEPDHLRGIHTRARLYETVGKLDAAARDFEYVLEKGDNTRPQDYVQLAELLDKLNPKDPTEAISILNQGIEKLGDIISLQIKVYDLEKERRNFKSAHAMLDKMMEPLSRKERLMVEKADLYLLEGNPVEAAQYLVHAENAIAQLPTRLKNIKATTDLKQRIEQLKQQL